MKIIKDLVLDTPFEPSVTDSLATAELNTINKIRGLIEEDTEIKEYFNKLKMPYPQIKPSIAINDEILEVINIDKLMAILDKAEQEDEKIITLEIKDYYYGDYIVPLNFNIKCRYLGESTSLRVAEFEVIEDVERKIIYASDDDGIDRFVPIHLQRGNIIKLSREFSKNVIISKRLDFKFKANASVKEHDVVEQYSTKKVGKVYNIQKIEFSDIYSIYIGDDEKLKSIFSSISKIKKVSSFIFGVSDTSNFNKPTFLIEGIKVNIEDIFDAIYKDKLFLFKIV